MRAWPLAVEIGPPPPVLEVANVSNTRLTTNERHLLTEMLKQAKARLFEDDLAAGHFGAYPPDYDKRRREAKELEKLLGITPKEEW